MIFRAELLQKLGFPFRLLALWLTFASPAKANHLPGVSHVFTNNLCSPWHLGYDDGSKFKAQSAYICWFSPIPKTCIWKWCIPPKYISKGPHFWTNPNIILHIIYIYMYYIRMNHFYRDIPIQPRPSSREWIEFYAFLLGGSSHSRMKSGYNPIHKSIGSTYPRYLTNMSHHVWCCYANL